MEIQSSVCWYASRRGTQGTLLHHEIPSARSEGCLGLRTSSMRSCHKSIINLTWFLDIEVFSAKTFLSDCGEILDTRMASEVDTGLPDLGVAEFQAQVVKWDRLEGSPVKLNPIPDVKVGFPTGISPHGEPPLI